MTAPAIAEEINELMDELLNRLECVAELATRIKSTVEPEGDADARPVDG